MILCGDSSRRRSREPVRRIDRRIIGLGLPALGTLAVEPLYRLVDTAVVGRLGTPQLAGVAVAATVLSLLVSVATFITYGTTERVARRLGAGSTADAAEVGVQAVWLAVGVAMVGAPLIWLGARPVATALGADGPALEFGVTYLQISAFGIPFVLVTLAIQGTMRGAADFRTPLAILLASNVVNLVLLLVLVRGLGWGVAGAAWSTVIAQAGAGLAFVAAGARRLRPARRRRPSWSGMAPLLTAGRHLLLRAGSMIAVFTGATAVAARLGDDTLAAHQIATTMFVFLALVLDALSVPAQTLVADELGGEGPCAPLIARRVTVLSLLAGVVLALALGVLAPLLPHVFSNDPDVTGKATIALVALAIMLVPGAIAFAGDGVLIGAGDYRFLGRAALGYLLVVTPLAFVVLAFPSLGIGALWASLVVWMTMRAAVNSWRVRHVLPGGVSD